MSADIKTIIAKNQYKTKLLFEKFKDHRHVAEYYVRHKIVEGRSLEDLKSLDSYTGNYYWSVSFGRTCAEVAPGKIKIELKGRGVKIFLLSEIYNKVKYELRQRPLF